MVLADPRSELVVVRPFFEPFLVLEIATGKVKCSSNSQTRGVSFEFYTGTAGTYVFGYSGTNMNLARCGNVPGSVAEGRHEIHLGSCVYLPMGCCFSCTGGARME